MDVKKAHARAVEDKCTGKDYAADLLADNIEAIFTRISVARSA